MIETLKKWDEDLFLWLNSFHADWLDPIMFQMTETVTWIPLYAFFDLLDFQSRPGKRLVGSRWCGPDYFGGRPIYLGISQTSHGAIETLS